MKNLSALLLAFGITGAALAQAPVANFSGNPTTICAGQTVTWTNLSTGSNNSYQWYFPGATWSGGGNPTSSTSTNPGPRGYGNPGTYTVTLIATNQNGVDTMIKPNYITVLASPTVTVTPANPSICVPGSVTLTASGANGYTWTPSTALAPTTGATVVSTTTVTRTYTVVGVDANGCTDGATTTVQAVTGPPPAPTGLAGPNTVCAFQSGVIYTVNGVTPPAPNRTWTVPPGATITAGQGTRSITVTFGSTTGQVCCAADNACGSSAPVCMTVTVSPTPAVGTVGSITGSTTVCDNQTGVTYFIAPVANAQTYSWTATGGATITSGQGTTTVTIDFTTNNSSICVTASNSCNTSAPQCINVTTNNAAPGIPGAITGQTTVCANAAGLNYSIASVAGATTYSWTVPSGASITAGQGTRTITVTYGATSGSVCVTASNGCGTSNASCADITVDPNPAVGTIGTITGPTNVCANLTGVVYTVGAVANASSYNWTVPAGATITNGQGTNTITVSYGSSGGNVCVDAVNGCSSTGPVCLAVTTNPSAPGIPGAITGPATVCSGQANVSYSVATVPNTTVYTWTVPTGATINTGQGTNSIGVTFGTTSGTICVTAGNACGTSLGSCTPITVDPTPAVGTIGTITGPAAVCANQTGIIFTLPAVASASTYSWTVPAGATITNGQGTNTITVTFGTTAGNVCVMASNSCSNSSLACHAVTVDPSAPAIPGGITGLTTVCNGQAGVTYSVGNVANATVYTWTVPSGATITAGQGTNNITVTFGATSGTICVTAGNACGTSLGSCVSVSVDPNGPVGTIGAISGPASVCANQSNVIYSVAAVTNATTYNWSVPTGATITNGQGTQTITVTFGTNAGNVCLDASNSCSQATQACKAITVDPSAPAIPGGITGPTTVCNGQAGVTYTIGNVANASVYTWTVPSGATITAGQGTTSITVTFGATSGTICVTAGNSCGTSLGSCVNITVDPTPAVGAVGPISGPTAACANQTGVVYSIANVANATAYVWTVPTGATITNGQGTLSITVTYGNVSGNVCVTASNSCGASVPGCVTVTVSPSAPAIPSGIAGPTTVCAGQSGVVYTVNPVANALTYNWTVPAGSSVTAGQGTNTITVSFGSTAGLVCVTAGNGCGTSLATCANITVNPTALSVGVSNTPATCSNCCDGTATANATGGTAPYTYSWNSNPVQTTAAASGLCASTSYTVCVTDAAGCVTCSVVTIPYTTATQSVLDMGTISIYPNPATHELYITGSVQTSGQIRITMTSIFGQRVKEQNVVAQSGMFTERLEVGDLPSGIYLIEISAGSESKMTKILKVD